MTLHHRDLKSECNYNLFIPVFKFFQLGLYNLIHIITSRDTNVFTLNENWFIISFTGCSK
jgi:hypothetical protein